MATHNTTPLDKLSRPLRDLRISLTDRCNMRCRYCMPEEIFGPEYPFLHAKERISFDQIVKLVRVGMQLGLEKVRLTGGEPLLRHNVSELVSRLKHETGIADLALTTNGLLLEKNAADLKSAGLDRVNISLDAMDPAVFKQMGGGYGELNSVLRGIEKCKEAGLHMKLNAVIKKGVNESEILPILEYGIKHDIQVRFIEYMDVGCSNSWERSEVMSEKRMLTVIKHKFPFSPLAGNTFDVARLYSINESGYSFGIIASITRPFCAGCVRARLSSDGKLYTCLFSSAGNDLKPSLDTDNDQSLLKALTSIWEKRDDRYSEIREELAHQDNKVEMSFIGG